MKSTSEWLTESWSAADTHAQRLIARIASTPTGGLLVLPASQRRRTASGRLLPSILAGTEYTPAAVVCEPTLIPGLRRAFEERLAPSSVSVVEWCHPPAAAPADVTILQPRQLVRSQAAIGGYQAATIAVLSGDARWSERDLAALAEVMQAAPSPLIVVQEWADPALIATAVARIARVAPSIAQHAVASWSERRGGHQTVRAADVARGLLALCAPAHLNAA